MAKNIGNLLGGVYNSGILANPRANAKFNYEDADAALVKRALELDDLCRKHGTELKAAAFQFCRAHPAVTVALTGARTAAEVSDNVAMAEMDGAAGVLAGAAPARPRRYQRAAAGWSVTPW